MEYKVLHIKTCPSYQFETILNECGAAGWDLVGAQAEPDGWTCIFKRPL